MSGAAVLPPAASPSAACSTAMRDDPAAPSVTVIVLNWNRSDDTLACLRSLRSLSYPSIRLVMVDNGSRDGSVDAVRAAMPEVIVVETGDNLGYAGGNNAGIIHCLARFSDRLFLILNNDTVVAPDFLSRLVEATGAHPRGGMFGPKILRQDQPETISFAGGRWDIGNGACMHDGEGEHDDGRYDTVRSTEYLTGCAILIRREVLEATNGFDERFFLYYEDTDLSFRARALGFDCVFVPAARIWHAGSGSSGGPSPLASYFISRNRLLFAEVHLGWMQRLRLIAIVAMETVVPRLAVRPQPGTFLLRRLYWSIRSPGAWRLQDYADPFYRARLLGARDYLLRRFGNCTPRIRERFTWRSTTVRSTGASSGASSGASNG